jgi:hypothetical protein
MPVLTDTLAEDIKGLTASMHTLREDFAGFKADMRLVRWVGTFFAGILVVLVGAAITLSWGASALNSEVKQQGVRLDKVEGKLDLILQRLDQVVPKKGGG